MPADSAAGPGAHTPDLDQRSWLLPLWLLQALELAVAVLLVSQSVHVAGGQVLAAAGVALALCTLSAAAPLGVVRVCSPRVHLLLIRVLAAAMVLCVLAPVTRPDLEGIVILVFSSAALLLLAQRASAPRGPRRRKTAASDDVIDTTATVVGAQPAPDDTDAAGSAARTAGRVTGAAAAAGKRVVDQRRPQVEDGVKRTLRGAGRLAGRLSGPKQPPGGGTA